MSADSIIKMVDKWLPLGRGKEAGSSLGKGRVELEAEWRRVEMGRLGLMGSQPWGAG